MAPSSHKLEPPLFPGRFIVHHGLAAGFPAYYQEAGRAGRDGEHAHIALAYVPPHQTCVGQHIRSNTDTGPPCVIDQRNFRDHPCPYYDDHLCHYGMQARFIQEGYPGIEHDVALTLAVYQELKVRNPIFTRSEWKTGWGVDRTPFALYRLQQLGAVDAYTTDYPRGLEWPAYHVSRPSFPVTFNTVAQRLRGFLIQLDEAHDRAEREIHSYLGPAAAWGDPDSELSESLLRQALRLLLKRIYGRVLPMRYQMLRNQLDYAQPDETYDPGDGRPPVRVRCRRVVLRAVFDGDVQTKSLDEYECGFCDLCDEHMNFAGKKAKEPVWNAQADSLDRQLPDELDRFAPAELREMARLALSYRMASNIRTRATSRLEGEPDNLAALFLAGSLSRHFAGGEHDAIRFFRSGFDAAMRQGKSPDDQFAFYEAAAEVNAREAFRWISRADGVWNHDDGLRLLADEARKRFGHGADESRGLAALRQVRQHAALATLLAAFDDPGAPGVDTAAVAADRGTQVSDDAAL